MSDWHVYIIRTRLNTLYTGITTDVERRLSEHESPGSNGAKYLRSKGPLELVYRVKVGDRNLALAVEARIKKLTRADKDIILAANPGKKALLKSLGLSGMNT